MKPKHLARLVVPIAVCVTIMIACLATAGIAAPKIKSTSVTLTPSAVVIAEGDVVSLTAKMKPANSTDSLTWSSSDKSVATVTKTGVVTAKSQGSCTITVKTSSRKTDTCSITVKDYLTQEEAEQLIKDGLLTEDKVKELIKSNTLSEADVKKLVASNTLSEADVRRIAASYSGGGGISASEAEAIAKRVTGQGWADGTELTFYNPEKLSNIKVQYYDERDNEYTADNVTLTSASVTKSHNSDYVGEQKQQFKYHIHIEGTYTGMMVTDGWIGLKLTRSDGFANPSALGVLLKTHSRNYDDGVFSASGGRFVYDGNFYNVFSDYDLFQVLSD